MEPYKELSTITRKLPVPLTAAEYAERSDELARTCEDIMAEEQRASDVKAELKARMAQLAGRRAELTVIVRRKEEQRDVRCVLCYVEGRKGPDVATIRTDSAEEIGRRPMTDDEKQMYLPGL